MRNSHGRNSKERGRRREKGLDPFESRGETTTEKERKEKMGAASSEVAASNLSLSSLGRFTTSQRKHDTWPLTGHLATVH